MSDPGTDERGYPDVGRPLAGIPHNALPIWKRPLDLLVMVFGLVVLAPVLVAIVVAIKIDSPGPVLFSQERVGIGGTTFRMRKFRSMRFGSSDESHRQAAKRWFEGTPVNGAYKSLGDGRITKVGRLLRVTNMDEIPQLLNVLVGQMSIVGPRPAIPYELAYYEPWYFERLSVLPGMTGPWQVSRREVLSGRDMVRADIDYARGCTLLRDIEIIARTPLAIVGLRPGRPHG